MNAIILAAGMGTRLRPLTDDTPKSLVEVNGQPIVERQIRSLREIGVEDISIVTGYLHEKFNYLKEKYGVKLIYNDKYDIYNNAYSLYLAREHIKDSFILEGDVYLVNNFLLANLKQSGYFTGIKEDFSDEWIFKIGNRDELTDISIGSGTDYIMTGASYWIKKDGEKINKLLKEMVDRGGFEKLFWDDLIKDNIGDFDIRAYKIKSDDWVEIDSVKDLKIAETII